MVLHAKVNLLVTESITVKTCAMSAVALDRDTALVLAESLPYKLLPGMYMTWGQCK